MNPELNKLLDKTKVSVFIGNNAAFLCAVMCSLTFEWSTEITTASTDGIKLYWNPNWFISLTPENRHTVLVHELWHIAKCHALRGKGKSNKAWRHACDYAINNDMVRNGYTFTGELSEALIDLTIPAGTPEESIYESINDTVDDEPDDEGDIILNNGTTDQQIITVLCNIDCMVQLNKSCHNDAAIQLSNYLHEFLKPIIKWETVLYNFFESKHSYETNYNKRNKRYRHICLPSNKGEVNSLGTINYYVDVSGSVSDTQMQRFYSELKYILETFELDLINVIQFDMDITCEETIIDFTPQKLITGRRGTNLQCVADHIERHKPESVIVFSDLYCNPMRDLIYKPNLLWVILNNPDAEPEYGEYVHIKAF